MDRSGLLEREEESLMVEPLDFLRFRWSFADEDKAVEYELMLMV